MNRTLKYIDVQKWYHLETLKKFYAGKQMRVESCKDNNNKEFTFINFKILWGEARFIMHPKTKRLKYITPAVYTEVGFN